MSSVAESIDTEEMVARMTKIAGKRKAKSHQAVPGLALAHPCPNAECAQHRAVDGPLPTGLAWRTCAGGHGWLVEQSVKSRKCHLCNGFPNQPIAGKTHVPLIVATPQKTRAEKKEPRPTDEGYCYLGYATSRKAELELATLGPFPTLAAFRARTGVIVLPVTEHRRDNYVWLHYANDVAEVALDTLDQTLVLGAQDITKILLDSNFKDNLLLPAQREYMKEVEYLSLTAPYKLTGEQAELLHAAGIATHPLPQRSHPHPVHKTLENNLLFNTIRHLIKGQPTLLMNMKAEKAQKLAGLCALEYRLWNPGLTPRDLTRWTVTPRPQNFAPRVAVFHDSGHYVTPSFFVALWNAFPTLEKVFFTAILPFEARDRCASLHPNLYTLVHGDTTFQYVLADMAESMNRSSYAQPYSGLRWLETNEFSHGQQAFCVERLETYFAHHLFTITPKLGGMILREVDYLPAPLTVKIPALDPLVPLPHPWVPFSLYRSLLTHSEAISSYKIQDAWAKVRSLVTGSGARHLPMATLHHLTHLVWAVRTHVAPPSGSLYTRLRLRVQLAIFRFVRARFGDFWARLLFRGLWTAVTAVELATLSTHQEQVPLRAWSVTDTYDLSTLDATHAALYAGAPHHHSSAASTALSTNVLPDPHLPPPDSTLPAPRLELASVSSGSSSTSRPTVHLRAYREVTDAEIELLRHRLDVPAADVLPTLTRLAAARGEPVVFTRPHRAVGDEFGDLPQRVHQEYGVGAIALPPPIPAAAPQISQTFARRVQNTRELSTERGVLEDWDLPAGPYAAVPYPVNDCLLRALSKTFGVPAADLWTELCTLVPHAQLMRTDTDGVGLSSRMAHMLCMLHGRCVQISYPAGAPNQAPERVGVYRGIDATLVWHPALGDRASHWEWHQWGPVHQYNAEAPPANFAELWGGAPLRDAFLHLPFQAWTPEPKRARVFFEAWHNGEIGKPGLHAQLYKKHGLSHDTIAAALRTTTPPEPLQLLFVHGAPGSGKSWPIIKIIRDWAANNAIDRELLGSYFAFFRVALLEDWKKKLAFPNTATYCLKTWERVLPYNIDFLIVDELSQAPPGWLDFIAMENPDLTHIICLGDVCQGQFFSGRAEPLPIDLLPSAIDSVLTCSTPYLNYTRRLPQLLAARLGIQTTSPELGTITCSHRAKFLKNGVTLLPTMQDAARWPEMTQGAECYTFTSPQGREWENVQIVVTPAALLGCADEAWWTAMTRTKRNLHFVMVVGVDLAQLRSRKIFGSALGYNLPFDRFQHFPRMARCPQFFHQRPSEVFGCALPTIGEQLSQWNNNRLDDLPPALRALVPSLLNPDSINPRLEKAEPLLTPIAAHLPPATDPVHWCEVEHPLPREDRELSWEGVLGHQYPDARGTRAATSLVGNTFPVQSASHDSVLFPTSVAKRIRFSNAADNAYRFSRSAVLAPLIFERFREHYALPPVDPGFDAELFAECVVENTHRKLEKPIATLLANAKRADADWAVEFIHLFVKSQLKAKAETTGFRIREEEDELARTQAVYAKAGQTLATCADVNILTLGPVARYVMKKMHALLPPRVYLHGGKSLEDLDAWARSHAKVGEKFTCDFTAYDQSCTEETLGFEVCLTEYLGIPAELIGLMVWVKLRARTQLGEIAVQRLTGEAFTYAFNTLWNMAYMAERYEIPPECARCFSGDDSLFFATFPERTTWPLIEHHFTLEGKTVVTPTPEFCGWLLHPCGAIRNPALLALKIAFRESRGELEAVLDSYYLEALFAHRIGDALTDVLPPLQLEAQRWVMDFCHKHARIVHHLSYTGVRNKQFQHIPVSLLPHNLK